MFSSAALKKVSALERLTTIILGIERRFNDTIHKRDKETSEAFEKLRKEMADDRADRRTIIETNRFLREEVGKLTSSVGQMQKTIGFIQGLCAIVNFFRGVGNENNKQERR